MLNVFRFEYLGYHDFCILSPKKNYLSFDLMKGEKVFCRNFTFLFTTVR